MDRQLIVRQEAEADIANAALWYDNREPGLGLEFLYEVNSAIVRALKNPEAFTRVRRNPTVRRVLTRRFPYRVFFIVRTDAIIIFSVLHAARHDRVWKHQSKNSL